MSHRTNHGTRTFALKLLMSLLTVAFLGTTVAQEDETGVQPTPEGFDKYLVYMGTGVFSPAARPPTERERPTGTTYEPEPGRPVGAPAQARGAIAASGPPTVNQ